MNIKLFLNFIIIASCIFIGFGCGRFSEVDRQKILLNKQLNTYEKNFFEVDNNLRKIR